MIRSFRAEELQRLLSTDGQGPLLSLYLPTHRRHPEWKQDPVRFRALVHQAGELLGTRYKTRDAEAFLEPLRLLETDRHWEFSLDGLALFRSENATAVYRLPIPVPELVVVADTYHTKPLLKFLHSIRRYLVLAVSQNAVSLYEGSPFGAGEVNLAGVPSSLREALGIPNHDRSFSAAGGWVQGGVFHGRGPGKERKKEELLRFFNTIDRGLHEYLRDERVPLVLAAVKYYHPIYRQANRYPDLLEAGLEGNYERAPSDQIHAEAWPLVSRALQGRIETWVARYRERAGTGRASEQLEEIAAAAVTGRVQLLLVAEEESVWGVLDRKTGSVQVHPRQMNADDADVLDDIAEESLKRGGEVYVVPRAWMPGPGPIAALFRF